MTTTTCHGCDLDISAATAHWVLPVVGAEPRPGGYDLYSAEVEPFTKGAVAYCDLCFAKLIQSSANGEDTPRD